MTTEAPEAPAPYPGHGRFLPYLINRATSFLNAELQRELDARGLTLTQWRVLAFLCEQDGLSVGALADATVTEPSTLSRALVALDIRGFVRRVQNPADSRSIHVYVVDAGRAMFDEVLAIALRIEARAFEGLDEDERAGLRRLLERIMANLGR